MKKARGKRQNSESPFLPFTFLLLPFLWPYRSALIPEIGAGDEI
jgi:hypothetical protein